MSQRLKAKFSVVSVGTEEGSGEHIILRANAVYGTEGENVDFTAVTPFGELRMGIQPGAPAASVLKAGDQIYLYLEKIEESPKV